MKQNKIIITLRNYFFSLPNAVYGFDSEHWWNPTVADSYVKLVGELSIISHGQFQPTDIIITSPPENSLVDGDKLILSFNLKDKANRYLAFSAQELKTLFVIIFFLMGRKKKGFRR